LENEDLKLGEDDDIKVCKIIKKSLTKKTAVNQKDQFFSDNLTTLHNKMSGTEIVSKLLDDLISSVFPESDDSLPNHLESELAPKDLIISETKQEEEDDDYIKVCKIIKKSLPKKTAAFSQS